VNQECRRHLAVPSQGAPCQFLATFARTFPRSSGSDSRLGHSTTCEAYGGVGYRARVRLRDQSLPQQFADRVCSAEVRRLISYDAHDSDRTPGLSMADRLTKTKRSWLMSRVRNKDTGPEKIVRSFLHQRGFRFRLHVADLPGAPDIVLPKYGTVVFVHGCFWHSHSHCKRASIPANNRQFWKAKLRQNVARDRRVAALLRARGWTVLTVWSCQTHKTVSLSRRLLALLRKP
jgi:DNA mismatch endonuclease, patch repair protein